MAEDAGEIRKMGAFFGPEAFIVLPWAVLLDVIGIVLVCFGLDDFNILDIVSISTIGLWSFWRSQMIGKTPTEAPTVGQKAELKKTIKGLTKMKGAMSLKWIRPLCMVGEIIPYLGAGPWLTLWVISELRS